MNFGLLDLPSPHIEYLPIGSLLAIDRTGRNVNCARHIQKAMLPSAWRKIHQMVQVEAAAMGPHLSSPWRVFTFRALLLPLSLHNATIHNLMADLRVSGKQLCP